MRTNGERESHTGKESGYDIQSRKPKIAWNWLHAEETWIFRKQVRHDPTLMFANASVYELFDMNYSTKQQLS